MVNAQDGRLILIPTCEIRLHLSKFFCYKHCSNTTNLLTVKQLYEIGPTSKLWMTVNKIHTAWLSDVKLCSLSSNDVLRRSCWELWSSDWVFCLINSSLNNKRTTQSTYCSNFYQLVMNVYLAWVNRCLKALDTFGNYSR